MQRWTIILNDWTLPSSTGVVLFWKGSMQQVKGCLPNTMNPFQNIGSTLFAEYKRRIIHGKINSFKTVCVLIRLYTWKTAKTHFVSMTQLVSSLWYKVRHLHFRHAHTIGVGTWLVIHEFQLNVVIHVRRSDTEENLSFQFRLPTWLVDLSKSATKRMHLHCMTYCISGIMSVINRINPSMLMWEIS